MYLIFDTETTGLPKNYNAPITHTDNWPRCVQIAWQLHDAMGKLIAHQDYLIQPEGFNIPFDAEKIHGISTELAQKQGISLEEMLQKFNAVINQATFIVGQNVGFDINIMGAEFYRKNLKTQLTKLPVLDTCTEHTAQLCQIPGGRGGKMKLPTLTELHQHLFNTPFAEAHNATADVEATTRCFLELIRRQEFTTTQLKAQPDYFDHFNKTNPTTIQRIGLKHINLKKASEKIRKELEKTQTEVISDAEITQNITQLKEVSFAHLHNHSQFSILQSTSSTTDLVKTAAKLNMPALALTDTGNMMGAFHFVKAVTAHNAKISQQTPENSTNQHPIKPIVGCEFFVCEDRLNKNTKDNGYQIVFLAKNKKGYHNLTKMVSISYTEGFYYVPRIDKKVIEQYKEDLIVLTGSLYGEVPAKILNTGEQQAEEALLWWKKHFKDDLYIELNRHHQENEDRVNPVLIALSKKHQVKLVATNNTYYIQKEDANAHDILLCVKDGEKQATPIGRGRGYRYGLPNQEYYFKSAQEMKALFKDQPEAIENIQEIIDKITPYTLARNVLLPKFDIPKKFLQQNEEGNEENAYLKHLTFEGAKKRYPTLTTQIQERLDFELNVIANTGYPGYFLIVQDFIAEARKMGVSVGPGRGSAAGSAVAYCLGITNIDPIKYDLLFERFLNPDRVSMPDIDIDFDDEGRSKVMEYVINKYGANQVAQIITYGTMGGKSAIRDTARVLDLPLGDADRLAKLMPPMTKLNKIFGYSESEIRQAFRAEDLEKVNELITLSKGDDLQAQTINQAKILEGSLRNTGIHACGVIITPGDITNYVPVATAKDSDLYVTQFDNSVVEEAGLLKMDFLGLKNLTIIKDAVELIKKKRNIALDPDQFPLDNKKTFELFQKGETVATFQYESAGMQKYMKDLKPTVFADLIAMNALYRPGPIEYIPSFIKRKNGEEEITYDLPIMEKYLKETYGITVYQEQVMLLSQELAGFTKGDADVLRKAMGKKIFAVLEKMKPKFLEGGAANGHPKNILEKIWKDWEAFASYAFNKSHSTCYAWIGYQTAYLKANYPAEYMAAVLSNNMNDIKEVSKFMEECKRMGLQVLGPDVNESYYKFTVNNQGAIRFGMGAVKGVGANAVATIVANREKTNYKSVFDLAKRIDLRAANKKAFENLALAGGFDGFNNHRAQYLNDLGDGMIFIEKVLRYAAKFQENENSSQISLFGEASDVQIPEPEMPACEEWGTMQKLKQEKEVVGIYISGHPLDDFKTEMNTFCRNRVSDFYYLNQYLNKELIFGGVVTDIQHRVSKNGKGWASFTIEDYGDSFEFRIFGEDYLKFRHFLVLNAFLFCRVFVKEGWIDKNSGEKKEPRIQFTSIQMLQDVLEKNSKRLTIQLKLDEMIEKQVESLKTILQSHKGKHALDFYFFEPQEKIQLQVNSRKQKVQISQELLQTLEKEEILYKLN